MEVKGEGQRVSEMSESVSTGSLAHMQWRSEAVRGPGSTVTWGPPFPSPPLPLPLLSLLFPSPSPAAKRPSNPARGSEGVL